MSDNNKLRPISIIAQEIDDKWEKVSIHTQPYLNAMRWLTRVEDMYVADDAKSIILYFLSNAQGWKGTTARRIKAELKGMIS